MNNADTQKAMLAEAIQLLRQAKARMDWGKEHGRGDSYIYEEFSNRIDRLIFDEYDASTNKASSLENLLVSKLTQKPSSVVSLRLIESNLGGNWATDRMPQE